MLSAVLPSELAMPTATETAVAAAGPAKALRTPVESLALAAATIPTRPFLAMPSLDDAPLVTTRLVSYSVAWLRVRALATQLIAVLTAKAAGSDDDSPAGHHGAVALMVDASGSGDLAIAAHACWLAGFTPVVFNMEWPAAARDHIVARLDVRVLCYQHDAPPSVFPPAVANRINLSVLHGLNDVEDLASILGFSALEPSKLIEMPRSVPRVGWFLHTSGTTGTPKTVILPMRSIVSTNHQEPKRFLPEDVARYLASAPTFLPTIILLNTAAERRITVVLPAYSERKNGWTAKYDSIVLGLRAVPVAALSLTPTDILTLHSLVASKDGSVSAPGFSSVIRLMLGGEVVSLESLRRARILFPNAHIACTYGMTEGYTSFYTSIYYPGDPVPERIVYKPSSAVSAFALLDEDGNEIALTPGATGSLLTVVRNDSPCTGYVPDPVQDGAQAPPISNSSVFTFHKGSRAILIGDKAELTEDGGLVIIGRGNRKVKVNGVYVDLAYLDFVLLRALQPHLQLLDCSVMKTKRDQFVVFYVRSDSAPVVEDEKGQILKRIEDKMHEEGMTHFTIRHAVRLDRMPQNVSAKKDLKQLQTLAEEATMVEASSFAQLVPSTNAFVISRIAAEAMSLPGSFVGRDFAFLDLGMNSLTAVRVAFGMRKEAESGGGREMGMPVDLAADLLVPEARPSTLAAMLATRLEQSLISDGHPSSASEAGVEEFVADAQDRARQVREMMSNISAVANGLDGSRESHDTIVLTGATGFLGSFVLASLINSLAKRRAPGRTAVIACFVRAKDSKSAMQRLADVALKHGCPDPRNPPAGVMVDAIPADAAASRWGLDAEAWSGLARRTRSIIHVASRVHWLEGYASLAPHNVASTQSLIELAALAGAATTPFVYISSVAAIPASLPIVTEDVALPIPVRRGDVRMGYGQTKWAAEHVLSAAREAGLKAAVVVRPGFIFGHSESGASVPDDFIWRLIKSCIQLGAAPVLPAAEGKSAGLIASSVDSLSDCISHLALSEASSFSSVFAVHGMDPQAPTMSAYLERALAAAPRGPALERLPLDEWMARLESKLHGNALESLVATVRGMLSPSSQQANRIDESASRGWIGEVLARGTGAVERGIERSMRWLSNAGYWTESAGSRGRS